MTGNEARRLALTLPQAIEQDHHGRPSFRVGGKIFATLWTQTAMNVMAGESRILIAVAEAPDICSEVHWGKRLAAVQVALPRARRDLLEDLLAEAWARKAPASLVAATGDPFAGVERRGSR